MKVYEKIRLEMKKAYMCDGRTKEETDEDIRRGNQRARDVMERFKKYFAEKYGEEPIIEQNGCESGKGDIIDIEEVTGDADYIINGHLVEVKTAQGMPKKIWLKKYQVDKLVEQGGHVLFFMGNFHTGNLVFTMIPNAKLKEIAETAEVIYPQAYAQMKACYIVDRNQFVWDYLPD